MQCTASHHCSEVGVLLVEQHLEVGVLSHSCVRCGELD